MSKELEALETLKDMLIGNGCNSTINDYVANLILPIKQALLKAQEDEKLKVDICEMFGLDNLFPYNDTKAILKELEEYMGRKNQLWVDFMKTSKELKEQQKVLEILKKYFIIKLDVETELNGNVWGRLVSIQSKEDEGDWDTTACANLADYKEDFDTLKEWLEI